MYLVLKRVIDFFCSWIALILLLPFFLMIAFSIAVGSPGPIFYRGLRAARGGSTFYMLKFRTMVINADKIGGPSTSADDPRVTPIGAFLRRYKLDELPQLINVLKGEMSFVGPRPEVLEEVSKYTDEERKLLSVRPGITDWASIRFRNEAEILRGSSDPHRTYLEKIRPEKVRLGLEYVRQSSFLIDITIILRTLRAITQ